MSKTLTSYELASFPMYFIYVKLFEEEEAKTFPGVSVEETIFDSFPLSFLIFGQINLMTGLIEILRQN